MTNSVQRIFVSHSSKDAEFGKKLVEDLRQALGSDDAVWYDKLGSSRGGGLLPGDSWWDTITKELTARQFFLLIASADALASPWVKEEIKLAWKQHVEQGKYIIPLMWRDCALPIDIATLHFIDFRDVRAYSNAFHQLVDVLGLPIGMDASEKPGEKIVYDLDRQTKPEAIVQQSLPQLKKLFDEQKWNRVLEDANTLIRDRSGAIPSDVYRMQGLAYLHMGNIQQAEEALTAAFALLDDSQQQFSLLLEYMAIFHEKDQWDKIRDYTNKILDLLHDDQPLFTTVLKIMNQMVQGEKVHYSSLDDDNHPQPVQYLTYSNHTGSVFSVDWSPNGKYLASASTDQTVQVWECTQPYGRLVIRYAHKQGVRGVAWSPPYTEEQYLATACNDGNVYLWQLFTENPIHTFKGHKRGVRSVAWSRDGAMLASGSSDGTVCLWDMRERRLVHTFKGHSNWVNAVSWSPNGSCIASASSDGTVKIWNINTRECQLTYAGHDGKAVNTLIWSPNGGTIGSAGDDKKVHLWESGTGNLSFEYKSHDNPVTSLARSRHGRRLASVSRGTIRVWYAATGDAILTNFTDMSWVRTVAWSPDDTMIAVAGDDNKVRIWNIGDEL